MNCDCLETQHYYSSQHSGQEEEQCDLLSWLSYTSAATIGNEIQNHSTTLAEAPNISATPEHPVPDMISEAKELLESMWLVPAARGAAIVPSRVPKKVLQFAGIDDVFA
nr:40S ribosomal protein S2-4 [Tanacetum cinerariifolium]